MACSGRPNHFKFFKGSLTQILLGPFLNTMIYLLVNGRGKVLCYLRFLKNTKYVRIVLNSEINQYYQQKQ